MQSAVFLDVFTRDVISTHLMFTVCIRETDRKPSCFVCVALFQRLSHPAHLMHRVIFLPLTAPLAPADTNRMGKEIARLYVAEEY